MLRRRRRWKLAFFTGLRAATGPPGIDFAGVLPLQLPLAETQLIQTGNVADDLGEQTKVQFITPADMITLPVDSQIPDNTIVSPRKKKDLQTLGADFDTKEKIDPLLYSVDGGKEEETGDTADGFLEQILHFGGVVAAQSQNRRRHTLHGSVLENRYWDSRDTEPELSGLPLLCFTEWTGMQALAAVSRRHFQCIMAEMLEWANSEIAVNREEADSETMHVFV